LLAPTVNIVRSPLAGRNFETYGEDPYLTGTLASAYIEGLQSKGVGACIKHFVANDSEFERHSMSSDVDKRTLHEIYLTPFRMALAQAQPWASCPPTTALTAHSPASTTYLLRDLLKGEWAFDGLVISDWSAPTATAAAGALDLEMPGPARYQGPKVADMVRRGELDEAIVDDKVRRLLRTLERARRLCQPHAAARAGHRPAGTPRPGPRDRPAKRLSSSRTMATCCRWRRSTVAVIGENARWAQPMGGGSSSVNPHYVISPLQGIASGPARN
jgi:beta-glucosidase